MASDTPQLVGKWFYAHFLNGKTAKGELVLVEGVEHGFLHLNFLKRPDRAMQKAWVPISQITSLYDYED